MAKKHEWVFIRCSVSVGETCWALAMFLDRARASRTVPPGKVRELFVCVREFVGSGPGSSRKESPNS